jgi:hypothetical protein
VTPVRGGRPPTSRARRLRAISRRAGERRAGGRALDLPTGNGAARCSADPRVNPFETGWLHGGRARPPTRASGRTTSRCRPAPTTPRVTRRPAWPRSGVRGRLDPIYVEALFGQPPFTPEVEAIVDHLLGAHTTIEDVGEVAERAGARTLVLNHFVPGNNPPARWLPAHQGFSGQLVVGEDLMQIGVTRGARARGRR